MMDLMIHNKILEIRGVKVIPDFYLAELYQVETKALKQAVRRNIERFPPDFMFELTKEEADSLRSHFVTLENRDEGGRGKYSKYLPFVFTEQGVAMLSSVLRSQTAIEVNIAIMRAFVALRQSIIQNSELYSRIDQLERYTDDQIDELFEAVTRLAQKLQGVENKTDRQIQEIYSMITQLFMEKQESGKRKRIGYIKDE